jgi:hypothetical protein
MVDPGGPFIPGSGGPGTISSMTGTWSMDPRDKEKVGLEQSE